SWFEVYCAFSNNVITHALQFSGLRVRFYED
ncbi:hypothetical protein A2U01_0038769, partial [Trifolium medium]|nr:hypothetical protein [Trifolium medium]